LIYTKLTDIPIPNTLEEAIDGLVQLATDTGEIEFVRIQQPDELMATIHHGFGTAVRNYFGLWFEESPVVQDIYKRYGVKHGDDCSGLILQGAIAKMQGTTFDFEKEAKSYKEHWKKCDKE